MFLGLTIRQWIDIAISLLIFVMSIPVSYWLVERLAQRMVKWLANRTQTSLDDQLIEALFVPGRWLVVIAATEFAVGRLRFLARRTEFPLVDVFFVAYLILIVVIIWRVTAVLFTWYGKEIAVRTASPVDEHLMPFFRRIALIIVALLGMSTLLSHFSIDVSGLVATLGIGSLAIALAAQAALEDTVSGFVIMVDRPFRIGDRIELLDLDTWGDVIDIGLRSSRIRTRDNRMVIVPNSVIGRTLIVNHSYPDTQYRIQIHVGVAYGSDLEYVRQVLIDAVRTVDGVLEDQPVDALFLEFGDSALIFRVRWWIESYMDTRFAFDRVNTAIYGALNEAGISIPFPQRDVHHFVDANAMPNIERVVRSARGRGE